MMTVIGLGSNVGDRKAHLTMAVHELAHVLHDMHLSSIYETKALLMPGAPSAWDMPFYNMAVAGNCPLTPLELLDHLKHLETRLGRKPTGAWGPREIDLDILAMGYVDIESDTLTIPHPELLTRDFALVPLAEVAPDWVYPKAPHKGKTAMELVKTLSMKPGDDLKKLKIKIK